jgi:hypothetical protein
MTGICLIPIIMFVFKKDTKIKSGIQIFKGDAIDSTCSLYLPNNGDARIRKIYLMNLIEKK